MKSLVNKYCVGLNELRHKGLRRPYFQHPKKSKNVMLYRERTNKKMAQAMQKETEKYARTNADTATPYTIHTDAQHMVIIAHDMAELTYFREYATVQVERCQEILVEKSCRAVHTKY